MANVLSSLITLQVSGVGYNSHPINFLAAFKNQAGIVSGSEYALIVSVFF